ncbi:MAG TPA: hypothetical protein VFV33_22900, partial [Gemmatimonadaceae bacterium]|nr:hypothetical protein [Gemmatimonadaceae bacterium]
MPRPILRALRTRVLMAACTSAAVALAGCSRSAVVARGGATPFRSPTVDSAYVLSLLSALAHDSMAGRMTGSPGGARAARLIADQMARIGLSSAGDSGFFQRVPLYQVQRTMRNQTRTIPALAPSFAALDTIPAARRLTGVNVVGIMRGSDPALAAEAVLVDAHYD